MKILVPAAVVLVGLLAAAGSFLLPSGPREDYQVPARSSMSPTLAEGDRITVRTDTADDLRRGDIVLIDGAEWVGPIRDSPAVKRIIGIGGDRVQGGVDGRIEVNGRAIDEDYLSTDPTAPEDSPEFDVTVPDGTIFVAGDQRNNSLDSRWLVDEPDAGGFTSEAVLGTVVAINGESLSPTTAFTNAGLDGDAYEDTALSGTQLLVLIGGAIVAALGAAWLVLTLLRGRAKAAPIAT